MKNECLKEALKQSLCNLMPLSQNEKHIIYDWLEKDEEEIKRLNNIINELEKEINERITNIKNYGANFGIKIPIEVSNEIDNKLDELNYCLRTLKKLKGDSSND